MTTQDLANFIAPYLAPARRIAIEANLPKVQDITSPATATKLAELEQQLSRPSTRTYYLGANGRVSQRKHLVGEVIATTRAYSTNMAWSQFSRYEAMRSYPAGTPRPYIGTPELCKCGRYHAKGQGCYVQREWSSLAGYVQTAPEMPEVVR